MDLVSVTLLVNLWSRLCPDLIFWFLESCRWCHWNNSLVCCLVFWFLESGRWCHWNSSLVCCLVSIYYAGCSRKSSLFTDVSYIWIEHWALTVSLWTQLTPTKILESHHFSILAKNLMQLKSRLSFLVHHVIWQKVPTSDQIICHQLQHITVYTNCRLQTTTL